MIKLLPPYYEISEATQEDLDLANWVWISLLDRI